MANGYALRRSEATHSLSRWVAVGFFSGFISVLVFHQVAAALLHAAGWLPAAPYSVHATAPFGVPQVLSFALWGGLWGAVLAATFASLDGAKLIVAAVIFGAIFPTLVAWFVVAPLKGQPVAAGFAFPGLAIGPIVNAAWGLGTGIGLAWLGRERSATPRP